MNKNLKKMFGVSSVALAGIVASVGLFHSALKDLPKSFTVTAHTGCEGTEDNSLESIIAAKSAGADIVEFDLRFDKNGKGILSHDEGEKNPVTLEDAFALVAEDEKIKVNVDCKTTENLKEVYFLSEKYGITERIFYTGIEEKDVEAAKTQTPDISYFLNYSVDKSKKNDSEYINSLISLVKEKGAAGLNIHYSQCSKKMTQMFHREGLTVSLWTANDIFSMVRCLRLSPDNITTRYPKTLINLINNLRSV